MAFRPKLFLKTCGMSVVRLHTKTIIRNIWSFLFIYLFFNSSTDFYFEKSITSSHFRVVSLRGSAWGWWCWDTGKVRLLLHELCICVSVLWRNWCLVFSRICTSNSWCSFTVCWHGTTSKCNWRRWVQPPII